MPMSCEHAIDVMGGEGNDSPTLNAVATAEMNGVAKFVRAIN